MTAIDRVDIASPGHTVERAHAELFARISRGEFLPGQRLREAMLAKQLGISRTPIRDALRQLATEGVVELSRNRGARVATFTDDEVAALYQVRADIEPRAAALAVQNLSPQDLAHMDDLCSRMEQIVSAGTHPGTITPLNNELHRMFIEGCGNRHLTLAIQSVVRPAVVTQTFRHYDERQLQRSMQHHRELLEAARIRDGEWAEAVMRAHILAARHAAITGTDELVTPF